ncbi:endoplasmic reticulum mannosyl-oligosaccharide -alpha-mannosidase [Colletotrichum plurivorum]|uniref:alpha-1,2-Mannosidase n=1 Tax=Colletotrichum plurivorum TaxID=2175906 RepID=A0A8H6NFX2_9PEZI|nr:endoplasmic reticulum mannosyl-oligosaccharide -alpha-mannosidase [Colletotrichum plurivorum]
MITIRRRPTRLPIYLGIALTLLFFWHTGLPIGGSSPRVLSYDGIIYRKSSYDWGSLKLQYPHEKPLRTPPRGTPLELPRVQYDFAAGKSGGSKKGKKLSHDEDADREREQQIESRRVTVANAFRRSWASYSEHAWTWDELTPVSGHGKNTFGGWAASMVDGLDTLYIMGMHDEFKHAVRTVALIDWANTTESAANMFETTIRHLGGLISAYDLSGEPVLLAKAIELGDMLYMGFDTPNHMPPFWFKFSEAKYGTQSVSTHESSAAGCSLSMEFTRLSQITGDPKYYDATERVKEFLVKTQHDTKLPGMWPTFLNYREEKVDDSAFTIGAQADSLYEYLPKMYALLGGLDPEYEKLTTGSFDAINKHILFRPILPNKTDVLVPGNVFARTSSVDLTPEAQHLGCFAGAMYALAGKLLQDKSYLSIGEKISRGCAWAYKAFPTGIMPEIMTLHPCDKPDHAACEYDADVHSHIGMPPGVKDVRDGRYILRPEAIESVFYMYRITGDDEWRELAWDMFQAIQRATETPLAYSAISNVNVASADVTTKTDSMESFWFSETLKYFYLIFSPPDVVSLNDWVLNTEAHPFKRPKKTQGVKTEAEMRGQ